MKHLFHLLLALACFLTASSAFAQVDVRIQPIRNEFLVGEPVSVQITLSNHSDRTITLRNTDDLRWLNFTITRRGQSYPISATAIPKFPAITIGPGSKRAYTVDLKPYFNLGQDGRYNVSATIVMEDTHTTRTSNKATFTLSQGGTVWQDTIQARGQRLRVAVKMLTVDGGPCLFGQVTNDSTNVVMSACFLGRYLSFMKPCIRLDSAMNVHVLCQSTPEFFTYSIMDTYGKRASQKFYRRSGGPVDLVTTGGGLRVMGLTPYTKQSAEDANTHSIGDRPH